MGGYGRRFEVGIADQRERRSQRNGWERGGSGAGGGASSASRSKKAILGRDGCGAAAGAAWISVGATACGPDCAGPGVPWMLNVTAPDRLVITLQPGEPTLQFTVDPDGTVQLLPKQEE